MKSLWKMLLFLGCFTLFCKRVLKQGYTLVLCFFRGVTPKFSVQKTPFSKVYLFYRFWTRLFLGLNSATFFTTLASFSYIFFASFLAKILSHISCDVCVKKSTTRIDHTWDSPVRSCCVRLFVPQHLWNLHALQMLCRHEVHIFDNQRRGVWT